MISFLYHACNYTRKQVDIEVNGEPVNIHMKLGESGEAFFVQECPENDLDELPENLATSPLPSEEYANQYNERYIVADTDVCSFVLKICMMNFAAKRKINA